VEPSSQLLRPSPFISAINVLLKDTPVASWPVQEIKMRPIDDRRFKGLPLPAGMPVTGIGDLGWNALRDLEYPALVLHEELLVHNITMMADCRRHRVELAPHAKTSLL
jgi:hypothetical protein